MASIDGGGDMAPVFSVGQHESNRTYPVTAHVVQQAHESNYDMVTTPITTPYFHSRVLTLLSSYFSNSPEILVDLNGSLATSQNTNPLTIPQLTPLDTHLAPDEAVSQVIGAISPWIDLCSPDPLIADVSRQVLMLEVSYAAFCGIGYLLVPGPKPRYGDSQSEGTAYYARAIQDALTMGPYIQFHIWVKPTSDHSVEMNEIGDLRSLARKEFLCAECVEYPLQASTFGTWDSWNLIRGTCKYHSRLLVALALPKQLPSMVVQSRWYSEPVHILTVDATSFLKNQKGYPVLSKAHQALVSRFMRLRAAPWILLCDVGPITGVTTGNSLDDNRQSLSRPDFPSLSQAASTNTKHYDPTPHLSYIRNLQRRQPPSTAIERFGMGYQDYLQAPLQPLTVNLESITYEVFEKDPVKYEWYERAIAKALKDWAEQKKPTSNPDGRIVVAVVGAGRGPLVTRALQASADTGVQIDLWVVEKNPNAFVLLQRHNETLWNGKVTLVQSDMRSWKGPRRERSSPPQHVSAEDSRKIDRPLLSSSLASGTECADTPTGLSMHIDIVVSELLGSFGDNELSPECLDGVTHLLNPIHGISIPASYSAHLTPIAAPKLHAEVMSQAVINASAPETPYVVMLHAIDYLSTVSSNGDSIRSDPSSRSSVRMPPAAEAPSPFVQAAWSFSHPNKNIPSQWPSHPTVTNAHNARRTQLTFPCRNRGVCHGLAGYFETVLYGDIELSTNPVTMGTKSSNMISWFPIYFPFKTPLNVPDNGEIVVTMYRQTDNRKVWYEWMAEVFTVERPVRVSASTSASPVMSGGRAISPGTEGVLRRVKVGMSDLHSSMKDGCLM